MVKPSIRKSMERGEAIAEAKEIAEARRKEREVILEQYPGISPEQMEKFEEERFELVIRQGIEYMKDTGQLESDGHGRVRLPPIN
jgi:hypothetical protein